MNSTQKLVVSLVAVNNEFSFNSILFAEAQEANMSINF